MYLSVSHMKRFHFLFVYSEYNLHNILNREREKVSYTINYITAVSITHMPWEKSCVHRPFILTGYITQLFSLLYKVSVHLHPHRTLFYPADSSLSHSCKHECTPGSWSVAGKFVNFWILLYLFLVFTFQCSSHICILCYCAQCNRWKVYKCDLLSQRYVNLPSP